MDAHLFRRFCEALIPSLLGARVEKIHQHCPGGGPGVMAFTVYGFPNGVFALPEGATPDIRSGHAERAENFSRKRFLVLKADRKSPLLFVSAHRMQVNAQPPAMVMRMRKYLSDHRITADSLQWTERRLYLEVAADDAPVWLCLDMREGASLNFTPPPAFAEPAWPEQPLHELAENWRDWPVITPALRRTLPYLDAADGQALLMDLQAGGGDVFLYENEAGEREVSAWPLPREQVIRMGASWNVYRESVWDNPLSALALAGERQVYVPLATDARKLAAKPFSAEVKRLSRLLEKLDMEEGRLQAMCAKQQDALLLQAQLYRFGPEEKLREVELEPLASEGEGTEAGRILSLDPKLTVRGNMAALFHQAGRGKRGLEHLQRRRAAVQAEKDAAVTAMMRSEAALTGTGLAASQSVQARSSKKMTKNEGQIRTAPQGMPKQVQAFRSSDGFLLLRGRDTKGNALALKMAAPHDFWLHTANGPSAHVVIRRDHAAQEVPLSTLHEAGALAALKSWLRDEEKAEIQYSQARYIHSMKKTAPGIVRIDQSEGTFWVALDSQLEERLRLGGE